MYIFKNAARNLMKMSGRNLLIGLIVVVITSLSFASLSLVKTVEETENALMADVKINATIIKNTLGAHELNTSIDSKKLSLEEVLMFAEAEYINDFVAHAEYNFDEYSMIGYTSLEAMSDFAKEKKRLLEGTFFSVDPSFTECIIAIDFALNNNYRVGDYLKLTEITHSENMDSLKIVGIYEEDAKTYNKVITSLSVLESIAKNMPDFVELDISATYFFDNLEDLEDFKEYLKTSGLGNQFTLIYHNIRKFVDFSSAIKTIRNFATVSLILVLLVGGSILTIFHLFQMNERRYEIGVLSAIGMPKGKIVMQFIIEILLLTIISVSIGIMLGASVSVPIAKSFVEPQIEMSGIDMLETRTLRRESEVLTIAESKTSALFDDNTNFKEKLSVIIDFEVVLKVIGIGIFLSVISIACSLVFILRFEPLKILNSRF